jgi:DNA (cytosine-5)-methyltransferase 1
MRELLNATGRPWVIENVERARAWMKDPVTLCSFMFGRPMYRHRLFEVGGGFTLAAPPQPPADIGPHAEAAYTLLGCAEPPRWQREQGKCGWPHPVPATKAAHWEPGHFASPTGHEYKQPSERAFGIDWMRNRDDRAEAIPPCMTEWIGRQLWALEVA